jgi:hypothetical protein
MQTDKEANKESDEPKVMTLDEYKKQLGERSGPKFNLRKAGEGSEIDPKWKKTYAYKKEKEMHDEEEDEVHQLALFFPEAFTLMLFLCQRCYYMSRKIYFVQKVQRNETKLIKHKYF